MKTILVTPGPGVLEKSLPEVSGCIQDPVLRKAWIAQPTGYMLFGKSLLGDGVRPIGRFYLFNRDKDEPIHLAAGPGATEREVDLGDKKKKEVVAERWAGRHRVTAAERFELEARFGREEQALPDQQKQSDWLYWAMVAALMSGVLVAMLKFGLRAIATNGAPAA